MIEPKQGMPPHVPPTILSTAFSDQVTPSFHEVIIAGGGIGGIGLAIMLAKAGVDVAIFERDDTVRHEGLGINLLPHAMAVLDELGVRGHVERAGVQPVCNAYHAIDGSLIHRDHRGLEAGYPIAQTSISRGTLHEILYQRLARIDHTIVKPGLTCTGFEVHRRGVSVFTRKDKDRHRFECKLLIGADGVNSIIRRQLFPHASSKTYSRGWMMRGACWIPASGKHQIMTIGDRIRRLIRYPIAVDHTQNKVLMNWVAEFDVGRHAPLDTPPNYFTPEWVSSSLKDWTITDQTAAQMISDSEGIIRSPLADREPLFQYASGPVALLGDAAHPMLPFGSNGAAQALLDVSCLAAMVGRHGLSNSALSRYSRARAPVAARVVQANRRMGPEAVLGMPAAQAAVHAAPLIASYRAIAGFDVEALRGHLRSTWHRKNPVFVK